MMLAALAVAPARARAHHGSAVAQVQNTGPIDGSTRPASRPLPIPRFEIGLTYESTLFDRVRSGDSDYTRARLGSIWIHSAIIATAITLPSRTTLGATLPTGISLVTPHEGARLSVAGLGDLQLIASQDLTPIFDPKIKGPIRLALRGGATLPTGRYEPEARLSLTTLVPSEGGSLRLMTYDTRASLGIGVPSLLAGLEVVISPATALRLRAATVAMQPIGTTMDEIRWGPTVVSELSIEGDIAPWRLTLVGGLLHRHHGSDVVTVREEPMRRERVGGREELAASLGVRLYVTDELTCTLRTQLPFYQHVGGVQLVETFSTQLGCAVAFGF